MTLQIRRSQVVLPIVVTGVLAAIDLSGTGCWAQVQDRFGAAAVPSDEINEAQPRQARAPKPASVLVIARPPALPKREAVAGLAEKPAAVSMESLENSLNTIVKVEFVEAPLKDVVQRLSDVVGVPFVLSLKKLEEASVSADTPMTKSLQGLTLRSVLRLILKDLELTYVIRDEVIQITTPEDAESQLITRIYRCRDLIDWAAGRGPQAVGDQAKERGLSSLDDKRAIVLMETITSAIKPDSWDDVGGPGSIDNFYGVLVVSQTQEVHSQIDDFLSELRLAAAANPARGRKSMQERRKRGVEARPIVGGAGTGGGIGRAGGMGGWGFGTGGVF
ncbi:MAG TPA: hypothetical protein VGI40_11840 [Pirellulaceae bacterium]|jgi:hypothetical protein